MISSIREIRGVNDEETLLEMEKQFNTDLHSALRPLVDLLDKNIMPLDQASLQMHMIEVERWRSKVVRLLSLTTAFVQHAKGEVFRKKKEKGITGDDQDAHTRHISAGFVGMSTLLEGLVDCVDSRVNLCKKLGAIDADGANYGRRIPNAA